MKLSLRFLMVSCILIIAALTPADSFASPLHQKSFSISILSAAFEGPNSQGEYTVEGTYQASGYEPKMNQTIYIYVVFIDDGGVWPGAIDGYNFAEQCDYHNESCVSSDYVNGDTLGSIMIHQVNLLPHEDGVSMPFYGTFNPPAGAKQMRLYAQFKFLNPGGWWPALMFDFDILDPQPVLLPAPPEQTQETPTPPPTPTTEAGPCTIIVSPASATVNAGETVSFSGAAIRSNGVLMSNALVNLDGCGSVDGGGCVNPARTDPAGNFSFSYVAPSNTNQSNLLTIGVSVEGCPVVKSVPITIVGSSTTQNPGSWTCPSPVIGVALIFGLVMLQTHKQQHTKIHL
jgi:hypothetical protein